MSARTSERGSNNTHQPTRRSFIDVIEENADLFFEQPSKITLKARIKSCLNFLLKMIISYSTIMFFCVSFIFMVNVFLELVLFTLEELVTNPAIGVLVCLPQLLILVRICWNLTHTLWKMMIIVWICRYDDLQKYPFKVGRFTPGSIGWFTRLILALIIVITAVFLSFFPSNNAIVELETDDQSLFRNLTLISIYVGTVIAALYFLASCVWRHAVIIRCFPTRDIIESLKFFALLKNITMQDLKNRTESSNNNSSNVEMSIESSKPNNQSENYSPNVEMSMESLKRNNQSENNQNDAGFISKLKSLYENGPFWRNHKFQIMIRILACIWYLAQIILVSCSKPSAVPIIVFFTVLPLVLYYLLLVHQCKVKLFSYLSSFRTSKGPVILKALLGIWIVMGLIFTFTLVGFNLVGLQNKFSKLSDTSHIHHENMAIEKYFAGKTLQDEQIPYELVKNKNYRERILTEILLTSLVYQPRQTIEKALSIYFAGQNINWEIHTLTEKPPVFMHIDIISITDATIQESRQEYIVIRGTKDKKDFYEDFSLCSEILAITGFSKLVPITTLMPEKMIQHFVKLLSITEGILYSDARNHHDLGVMEYINKNVRLSKYKRRHSTNKRLRIIGHSLGGGVAHIVAAKLVHQSHVNVRSLGVSNFGIVWSVLKFGVNQGIYSKIATTIIPDHDPIPLFDMHNGQIQHIRCKNPYQQGCHKVEQTFCELFVSSVQFQDEYERMPTNKQGFLKCMCTKMHLTNLRSCAQDFYM